MLNNHICRNRNRDGTADQKNKTRFEKEILESPPQFILENYGKP